MAEAKKAGSKKKKDKQDDTQMSDGDSSGYSFSSDDELNMIAKKKHKRSGSLNDKESVKHYAEDSVQQPKNKKVYDNNMSFGDSEGSAAGEESPV